MLAKGLRSALESMARGADAVLFDDRPIATPHRVIGRGAPHAAVAIPSRVGGTRITSTALGEIGSISAAAGGGAGVATIVATSAGSANAGADMCAADLRNSDFRAVFVAGAASLAPAPDPFDVATTATAAAVLIAKLKRRGDVFEKENANFRVENATFRLSLASTLSALDGASAAVEAVTGSPLVIYTTIEAAGSAAPIAVVGGARGATQPQPQPQPQKFTTTTAAAAAAAAFLGDPFLDGISAGAEALGGLVRRGAAVLKAAATKGAGGGGGGGGAGPGLGRGWVKPG